MESLSLVSPEWELIDPNPDIYALFSQFNIQFFWGTLCSVEVKWSPRMTLCAGVCRYEKRAGYCSISLSLPLLKLRPRKDLVETLLHEMIHAYLFVTANNRDREGHGPEFQKHMLRINNSSGTNITIYHSFHAEVRLYKQHWWRCTGSCTTRPPFYGFVKRSMNRAPGPNDIWWEQHKATCSGMFIKVKEPEGYGKKTTKAKDNIGSTSQANQKTTDIRKFFSPTKETGPPSTKLKTGSSGSVKPNTASGSKGSPPTLKAGSSDRSKPSKTDTTNQKDASGRPTLNGPLLNAKHGSSGDLKPRLPPITGKPNLNGPSIAKPAQTPRNSTGGTRLKNNGATVTIQGKTSKVSEKNETNTSGNASSVPVFTGQGHTLGGAGRGVSRLLSQFSAEKVVINNEELKSSAGDPIVGESSVKIESNDRSRLKVSKDGERIGEVKKEKGRKRIYVIDSDSDSEMPVKNTKRENGEKSADIIDLVEESPVRKIEEKSDKEKLVEVICPVCNKPVPESSINEHLDSCIIPDNDATTEIVGDTVDDTDDIWDVTQVVDENATFYPCPICSEQVLACDMNAHLDRCAL